MHVDSVNRAIGLTIANAGNMWLDNAQDPVKANFWIGQFRYLRENGRTSLANNPHVDSESPLTPIEAVLQIRVHLICQIL